MSAAHTPGPWHVFRQGTKHFVSQAADEDFRFAIATVYEAGFHPDGPLAARTEAAANARLIAAAPELLTVLARLEEACTDEGVPGMGGLLAEARAAIAKAT